MAENGNINTALEAVQKYTNTYVPGFQGPEDGALEFNQLPQGLYEEVENFVYMLSQIDFIADFLKQNNIEITDAYDPALQTGLENYGVSEEFGALRDMVANNDMDGAQAYLRGVGAPATFVQDPSSFVRFIQEDSAEFTQSLNVLDEEGFLSAPPASAEMLAKQPEATEGLRQVLENNYSALLDKFRQSKEKQEEILGGEPEEAVRIEAQNYLDLNNKALELLEVGNTHLSNADFTDFARNEDAQKALGTYILFLQSMDSLANDAPNTGEYTNDFSEFLGGVLQENQALKNGLEQKGRLDTYEADVLDQINRLSTFRGAMEFMVETGAYRQKGQTNVVEQKVETMERGVMPEVLESEVSGLQAVIGRVPQVELAGANELIKTLSGYGFEEIMPLSANAVQNQRLHNVMAHGAADRSSALGALYQNVFAEAKTVLTREGRPDSDLEAELQNRLNARIDDLSLGHDVFDPVQIDRLKQYVENAASASLLSYNSTTGDEAAKVRAASEVFGYSVPSVESFIERHGANSRSYRSFNNETLGGILPSVVAGFAGEVERGPGDVTKVAGMPTFGEMLEDIRDDFSGLEQSPIAMKTVEMVADALETKTEFLQNIYLQSDLRGPEGELVLSDRTGHKVLMTQGDNGLEMRYLDALGVESLTDKEIPVLETGEEFGLDALMVQTAMAGFQAVNQAIGNPDHFAPEFFEVNGQHFVVGVDHATSMTQVKRLTPEFLSVANAEQLNYISGPNADAAMKGIMRENDAYRFIQDNYGRIFMNAGSVDIIFETMLEKVARGQGAEASNAAETLAVLNRNHLFDYKGTPALADLPLIDDVSIIEAVKAEIADRPEDQRLRNILYLQNDGDSGRVMLVIPPTKELVTGEGENAKTQIVHDEQAAPLIFDISAPENYTALRDRIIQIEGNQLSFRMDVHPPENAEDPQFSFFMDWAKAGAAPMERPIVIPDPVLSIIPVPDATEAGRESMKLSAEEFNIEDGKISFGRPITDVGALHEALGYDPAAVYRQNIGLGGPPAVLVHGLETENWNNNDNGLPYRYLQDHVLLSFEAQGEVITVGLKKEDFMHNPMRLPAMIQQAYNGDTAVDVRMVNGEAVHPAGGHDNYKSPTENLWEGVRRNYHEYKGPPELVESEVMEIRFSAQPKNWLLDANNYDKALREQDHSALDPNSRATKQAMIKETSETMTLPEGEDYALNADTRSMKQPMRLGA